MISECFWSYDYVTGIETLMKALEISIAENKQFLSMVQERARIEHSTASCLAQLSQKPMMHAIPLHANEYVPKSSTLQSALGVFTTETVNQAVIHTRIASDLDTSVHKPLQKWCDMYAQRVHKCGDTLNKLVARYQQLSQAVNKQRTIYYEQCHKYEDQTTSGGSPSDPIIKTIRLLRDHLTADVVPPSPRSSNRRGSGSRERSTSSSTVVLANSPKDNDVSDSQITSNRSSDKTEDKTPSSYTIAGLNYTPQDLADLLNVILQDITLGEYKVPLWGSYQDVTSGSMLATATRKHLKNDSFAYAEKFGQSLVDHGFLKPVGQISNKFQSTHTSHYQFQPLAFELISHESSTDESDADSSVSSADHSIAGQSVSTQSIASRSSVASNHAGNIGATDVSEEHYLQAVLELDTYRCEMELEMMQIYKFLDKLEMDREEALKRGMNDFIRISFRPEEQNQMLARLHGAQARINPEADLKALAHKNQTGPFIPTVTVFHGYANGAFIQTFGVDLPHSCFFVDLVLDWLPTLPEKETKLVSLWTRPEPIAEIYKLRTQINTGKPFAPDTIFRFFSLHVVISTFRQYLLELPESVVSFMIYERIKQLYTPPRKQGQPLGSPSRHESIQDSLSSPPSTPKNASSASLDMSTPQSRGKLGAAGDTSVSVSSPASSISSATNTPAAPTAAPSSSVPSPLVTPSEIATVLIQIPQVNRQVLKRIISYLRDRFPSSAYYDLASSMALPLVRPHAPSAVTMNDIHPVKFLHDLLLQAPDIFHSLDLKQKEMDAFRQEKLNRSALSGSPVASPSSTLRSISSHTREPSASFLGHSPSNNSETSILNGGSSGNVGMRPLSMAHHGRYSSLSKPGKPPSSRGTNSAGESSPARGQSFNPIVPLSLPLNHGQTNQGFNVSVPPGSLSPKRPFHPRMSSSTSASDLQLPKLRLPEKPE